MLTQEINAIINGERDLSNYKPPEELEDLLNKDKNNTTNETQTNNESKTTNNNLPETVPDLPLPYREGDGIKKDTYLL